MKRIALVVDVCSWAFDIEAQILKKAFQKYYDVEVFVSKDYEDNLFLLLEDVKDFDMIHIFWRKLLLQFESDEFLSQIKDAGYDVSSYISSVSLKISTGIYDHLFLDLESISVYSPIFQKYVKSYYTCSKKLYDAYSLVSSYPKPWGIIHDTYDDLLYDGGNRSRYEAREGELVVGWVGNSNWNIKYRDFKGFHSILEPVLDELIHEGYSIRKHYADKNIRFRTNEEMPSYYQEIDVCVVVSEEEGTPRPVVEAMASGVPILSTDVGIVSEVFGPLEKQFLLGDRTKEADSVISKRLKDNLVKLYQDRGLLKKLSDENYEYSRKNGIDFLFPLYKKYFDEFLKED